jgi:Phage integrase, N-terminal SAM-like domain
MTTSPRPTTPLRQRMIEDMKLRNLSPHTVQAYVDRVAAFAKHFGKSPQLLGPKEVRSYLVFLVDGTEHGITATFEHLERATRAGVDPVVSLETSM